MLTTENSTVSSDRDSCHFYGKITWIIPVSVNISLILITLWILMSLIDYGIKTRKWKKQSSAFDRLNSGIVYTFVVVCAIACLLFLGFDLIFMNVGDDLLCEVSGDVTTVLYSFVLCSVFLSLWFRQKAFYTNKAFANKVSRLIKLISTTSIIMITGSGLAYLLLFTVPYNFKASNEGCKLNLQNGDLQLSYGVYVIAFLFLSHVMLLCLFIYPLIRSDKSTQNHFSMMRRVRKVKFIKQQPPANCPPLPHLDRTIPCSRSSLSVKPSRNEIQYLMKKTFMFTLLSTVTDVSNQVICFFFQTSHRRFHVLMFDCAAFLNLLFLILSFTTHKKILKSLINK